MKNSDQHFSKIAHAYKDLRTTDLEPIFFIKQKLQKHFPLAAADIGCGDGRYDEKLLQFFGAKTFLSCVDTNAEMLLHLKRTLKNRGTQNFEVKEATAEKLPFASESLDCIFTFNAIHHFKMPLFLKECERSLNDGGYLFIYTRLRSQNARNIWGKYFPLFKRKETRLFKMSEMRQFCNQLTRLNIEDIEYFKFARCVPLDRLIEQAEGRHYSTFCLYTKDEFDRSLEQFIGNMQKRFTDKKKIHWVDENVLFVLRKRHT